MTGHKDGAALTGRSAVPSPVGPAAQGLLSTAILILLRPRRRSTLERQTDVRERRLGREGTSCGTAMYRAGARALCLVPGRGSSVADRDAPALSR